MRAAGRIGLLDNTDLGQFDAGPGSRRHQVWNAVGRGCQQNFIVVAAAEDAIHQGPVRGYSAARRR